MADSSQKASLRAVVSGRVQGVFFRMFVHREASGLGLCGTVRNLGDGRVEVMAEGDRGRLDMLVEKLRKGPPRATVHDVAVEWEEYQHSWDDFRIEYS